MSKTKTPRKPRTRPNEKIDHPAFVKAWNEAENVSQVATKLGFTPQRASSTARFLRTKGVKLQTFKRGSAIDVAALNKIAIAAGK